MGAAHSSLRATRVLHSARKSGLHNEQREFFSTPRRTHAPLYVTRVLRTPANAAVGVRMYRGGCVQGASPLATLCRPAIRRGSHLAAACAAGEFPNPAHAGCHSNSECVDASGHRCGNHSTSFTHKPKPVERVTQWDFKLQIAHFKLNEVRRGGSRGANAPVSFPALGDFYANSKFNFTICILLL